jgi:hypothetical protein
MSSGLGLSSGTRQDYEQLYSPLAADLKIGDRLRHMGTGGVIDQDSVVTTCGTAFYASTAATTSVYVPNHGIVRATATGYYTIQKPDRAGLDLTLVTLNTTDQYFRVSSAGSGVTAPTFLSGTGSTYVVFYNSSDGGGAFHLKSISTSQWILMTSTGSSGIKPFTVATSS